MQFDDFEENLNLAIKWLTVVSLIAIVIWVIMSFVKSISSGGNNADKAKTAQEQVKDDTSNSDNATKELLGIDDDSSSAVQELDLLLNDGEVQTSADGSHTFTLNTRELPENLLFGTIKNDDRIAKKREIINKKVGENYIDSVLSYGTLERWNPDSFPLKVYIAKNPNVPNSHINEIKNAFTKWQDTTNDFISFAYVDSIDKADIICSYPEDFYRTCRADESSQMSKQFFTYDENGFIKKSNIELTYKDCNNEVYAEDLVYAFALREIGHSLGLRGHSGQFQNKILYYPVANRHESVRPEINVADLNTLKLVYSVLPDKTNTEFTEEQRKKLLRPEDIWGDQMDRSVSSEKAILHNIERSPDIPSLHIALANHYIEQGKYDEALAVYSRSIVMLNDAVFKARVYVKVGDTYNSQQRYLEAIEAYKLSLKSLSDKSNLFNVYFNLGYIYYQQGKFMEALQAYQNAIQFVESKDTFYKLLMNLTFVYIKVENYTDAQKCADKAFSLQATKDSEYLVAYTRYLNEDYEGAEAEVSSLVDKYDSLIGYALLAQVYYKTEQYDKLSSLYDKAKDLFPENVPFSFE